MCCLTQNTFRLDIACHEHFSVLHRKHVLNEQFNFARVPNYWIVIFYNYRGRMNGSDINSLGLLPDKLKTELAIHVNLETLKKVIMKSRQMT